MLVERIEVERNITHRSRQNAARSAAGQISVELVTRQHAAAVLFDQFLGRDARRGQMHTRLFDSPRYRERPQALAPVTALGSKPVGTLFQYLTHPMERFHVVLERGVAEEAHLRHIRRPQPRHAALALDRFDHRRLLPADVGAGAAPQVDRRQGAGRIGLKRRDLALEDFAATRVLVAQVEIDFRNLHRPRRDDRAFEEAVRIALEIVAVFERPRLAFVDVDRHEPRRGLVSHDAPLATCRETRAAQPPQARIFHGFHDRFGVAPARQALRGEAITSALTVLGVGDVLSDRAFRLLRRGELLYLVHRRLRHRILADHCDRRLLAASEARRRNYAHPVAQRAPQFADQLICAAKRARQRLADAHRQCRRRFVAFLGDVEVVIESGDLVDFGHCELHLARQCNDMRRRDATVAILDLVQMLDQQLVAARRGSEQSLHFRCRARLNRTAFGLAAHGFAALGSAALQLLFLQIDANPAI